MRRLGSKPRDLTPEGAEAAREARLSSCRSKARPYPHANHGAVSLGNVAVPGAKFEPRQTVATPVALEASRVSGDIRSRDELATWEGIPGKLTVFYEFRICRSDSARGPLAPPSRARRWYWFRLRRILRQLLARQWG
jgi:hypothetical protein